MLAYVIVSCLFITGPCSLPFEHEISVYSFFTASDFIPKDPVNYELLDSSVSQLSSARSTSTEPKKIGTK